MPKQKEELTFDGIRINEEPDSGSEMEFQPRTDEAKPEDTSAKSDVKPADSKTHPSQGEERTIIGLTNDSDTEIEEINLDEEQPDPDAKHQPPTQIDLTNDTEINMEQIIAAEAEASAQAPLAGRKTNAGSSIHAINSSVNLNATRSEPKTLDDAKSQSRLLKQKIVELQEDRVKMVARLRATRAIAFKHKERGTQLLRQLEGVRKKGGKDGQ
ncbi:uncharacterized protein BDV14DRAFT_202263 [Aspergillus stella-maris]|uniref:uncharacterized protein n=1 Tax=Aspergillus stella-maris TaxID=1810926 RepID=UPI003CCD3AAE